MDLMVTSYLDVVYAEEILAHLPEVVRRMCEGCLIDSLSQRDHTCIDINAQEQLTLYFDDILAVIDERDILSKWKDAVASLKDVSQEYLARVELQVNRHNTVKPTAWRQRMLTFATRIHHLNKRL